ncbi:MAG: hypothetical protein QOF93_1260 [Verrucomicrobiota bacterium]
MANLLIGRLNGSTMPVRLGPQQLNAGHVPGRGLEPLRIAPPDPKSGASANFATLARGFSTTDLAQIPA